MNLELAYFIRNFINDFQIDEFTFPDVWIKLKILELASYDKTTTEIRKELNLEAASNNRQKILRIKKNYSHVAQLPKLIELTQLTKIILKRYPFPRCAGITPAIWNDNDNGEIWTGERLCRYIYSYFNIPKYYGGYSPAFCYIKSKYCYDINIFYRNAKSLQKYLNLRNNAVSLDYESILSNFFKFVFNNHQKYKFYYLMLIRKREIYYAVLFEMKTGGIPCPLKDNAILYRYLGQIGHVLLKQIEQLSYNYNTKNIIFVLNSSEYVDAFQSIRNGLDKINRNHLILGNNFTYFQRMLQPFKPQALRISLQQFLNDVEIIQNHCCSIDDITKEKKDYLKKIRSIIY